MKYFPTAQVCALSKVIIYLCKDNSAWDMYVVMQREGEGEREGGRGRGREGEGEREGGRGRGREGEERDFKFMSATRSRPLWILLCFDLRYAETPPPLL